MIGWLVLAGVLLAGVTVAVALVERRRRRQTLIQRLQEQARAAGLPRWPPDMEAFAAQMLMLQAAFRRLGQATQAAMPSFQRLAEQLRKGDDA